MNQFQFWIYSWIRLIENFICIVTGGFIQPYMISLYYLDSCWYKLEDKKQKRDSRGRFCK